MLMYEKKSQLKNVINSLRMKESLCLSQLVVMVREFEIFSPRVDVHLGTNNLAGHSAALNMPT
jgi:hypothetical protein